MQKRKGCKGAGENQLSRVTETLLVKVTQLCLSPKLIKLELRVIFTSNEVHLIKAGRRASVVPSPKQTVMSPPLVAT